MSDRWQYVQKIEVVVCQRLYIIVVLPIYLCLSENSFQLPLSVSSNTRYLATPAVPASIITLITQSLAVKRFVTAGNDTHCPPCWPNCLVQMVLLSGGFHPNRHLLLSGSLNPKQPSLRNLALRKICRNNPNFKVASTTAMPGADLYLED